jgi:hydrogenase maturation protein HypF
MVTTSAGRLFDAAACLILGITDAQFDGEPAMRFEDAADLTDEAQYPLPLTSDLPRQLDWRPLFAALWDDCRRGRTAAGAMSMRFHRAVAAGIAAVVREHAGLPVVLSGGVFQNRLLTELVVAELDETRHLCLPGRIPPNDGGLAAGQLAIALSSFRTEGGFSMCLAVPGKLVQGSTTAAVCDRDRGVRWREPRGEHGVRS